MKRNDMQYLTNGGIPHAKYAITSIYTGSSYREAVNTWNVALENGSDLHVNERQKIRHHQRVLRRNSNRMSA